MALIVYNRENSRPQEVTYKGKRTINLDSRGTVYLSKTMSIELGILGGGRVNFAHDDETDDWYICRAEKIGIISAMLHHPQLLILDEPFNFLDPSSQSVIKHLLKRYNEEHGPTVIISSHNLNHTVDVCPRIALLENGVIIRDIRNENNSAEQELEAYFNVGVEEEAVVEETVVEVAVEEITEKEDKTVEEKYSEA